MPSSSESSVARGARPTAGWGGAAGRRSLWRSRRRRIGRSREGTGGGGRRSSVEGDADAQWRPWPQTRAWRSSASAGERCAVEAWLISSAMASPQRPQIQRPSVVPRAHPDDGRRAARQKTRGGRRVLVPPQPDGFRRVSSGLNGPKPVYRTGQTCFEVFLGVLIKPEKNTSKPAQTL
jgi:hypothetical protein